MNREKIKNQIELLLPVLDVNIEIHEGDLETLEDQKTILAIHRIISHLKGQKEAYNNVLNWIKQD